MKNTILLINGPNLNLLGVREPELYGYESIEDIAKKCKTIAEAAGFQLHHFQSNHEGEIIDIINKAREDFVGIAINPAAFSHTSIAIMDALKAYEGPVMEVHLTNLHKREPFRRTSYVSYRADGVIAGCGAQGYELALQRLFFLLKK